MVGDIPVKRGHTNFVLRDRFEIRSIMDDVFWPEATNPIIGFPTWIFPFVDFTAIVTEPLPCDRKTV